MAKRGISGQAVVNHFEDVLDMVEIGHSVQRKLECCSTLFKASTNKALKGRNVIAQGNALDKRFWCYLSPERAKYGGKSLINQVFRPFRAQAICMLKTQGVALGYLMLPRCGKYRAALITNAVTGKIDVRGFEVPTPKHAELNP